MSVREIEDGIYSLQVSRPDRPFIDDHVIEELSAGVDALRMEKRARVVVVQGEAKCFSSGASRESLLGDPEAIERACRLVPDLLLSLPVPSIAAMEGHAIGGGFVMGLWCDFRVFAEESLYGVNFTSLGFTPGMGSTRRVEAELGQAGRFLLYSGKMVKGEEFRSLCPSLAPFVVPRTEVYATALSMARDIAQVPGDVLRRLKLCHTGPQREAFARTHTEERAMHAEFFHEHGAYSRIRNEYAEKGKDK